MLKEIAIILGAIGCIFLIIPMNLQFYSSGPWILSMPLVLLGFVLVYAYFDVIKLFDNNEGNLAKYFLLFIIAAIIVSSIIIIEILSYFHPNFAA